MKEMKKRIWWTHLKKSGGISKSSLKKGGQRGGLADNSMAAVVGQ